LPKLVRKKSPAQPDFYPNVVRICELADAHKAIDIRAYDVRGLTLIADAFVICSAASEPQLRAIMNAVLVGMKEVGLKALHTEGTFKGGWVVLDFSDIIFHVFREEAREFYDLDGLWGDAPLIEVHLDPEARRKKKD
jgi:ribosome-associated protein